jgi:hypothetical protein
MHKTPDQDQARTAQSNATKDPKKVMSAALMPLSQALGPQVAALEARAKQSFKLTDLVRAALPFPEKNHVLSASYRDDVLVISTDSPAWTAQVRYQEDTLRQQLQKAGEKPFTKLKVRVGQPPDQGSDGTDLRDSRAKA